MPDIKSMNFVIKSFQKKHHLIAKHGFWCVLLLLISYNSFSQISVGGVPESFLLSQKKSVSLPDKKLKTINIDSLLRADTELGIPNRYSIVQELNVNLRDFSIKTEIPGKGYIWQYKLTSVNAFSLGIIFKSFRLPEGGKVFIYSPDHSQILGAFTHLNNNEFSILATADIKYNDAIIEYFEPYDPEFQGELILGSVSIAYRDIYTIFSIQANIDINCSQGKNWQDEKRSVCRMTFVDGGSGYYCTGFLVNNARQDLNPYFMSANHCISSSFSASTLVTYFNYENSDCNSSDASDGQTLSGAKLISNSAASDFSLMLMNETPPPVYRAYLAGWDASGRSPLSGAGIHHPAGKPKAISVESSPVSLYAGSISWDNSQVTDPSTHWMVKFNSGTTEGGSSGSPFFDDNHRVVGQLHGGGENTSFYGAFKVSWDRNEDIKSQLKHWLDPDGTQIKFIGGKFFKTFPLSQFSTENTKVCFNNTVLISDNSKYEPTEWSWTISPENFVFVNGTSKNSKNPEIQFNQVGNYSVTLISSNEWGSDTLQKSDFFVVVSEVNLSLQGIPVGNQICGCDLNDYKITATGANDYLFTFRKSEKVDMLVNSNVATISLRDDQKKNGNFNSIFRVDGSIGNCTSSDSVLLNIVLPVNDDIADAILIYSGNNGPFSNYCSSGQKKEPFPGPFNCYNNSNWCPGTTADGIQNSIWFAFIGPSTGKISIDTKGINDRIAVYEADSIAEIISGKPTRYRIVAANDNQSALELSALLENIEVTAGKKYWLQVESLDADTGSVIVSLIANSLDVFPNPTNGLLNVVVSNDFPKTANISVISSRGSVIYTENIDISPDNSRFVFNLKGYPSGLYFVRTLVDGKEYARKIMLTY